MRRLCLVLLIGFLILSSWPTNSAPRQSTGENSRDKESRFIKPETIQGCYELGTLDWKPDLQLDKEEAVFITPPERIQILTEHGSNGFEKNGYLVRPAPGISPSIHRATYWEPTGPNTIEVTFTTGTSGLSMKLEVEGEALKGEAKTHWDFLRRGQRAKVIARRADCDWRKLDAGPFSILAPAGWEFHQLQGVDSYVGEFVGDGLTLRFDFGRYSSDLRETREPKYVIARESIGGLPAKIVSPRTSGHGITAIYFRSVGGHDALCLWGQDFTPTQQQLALKIFETLRFGGPVPWYVLPPTPPPAGQNLFHMMVSRGLPVT
jgi:hypothetical protein